MKFKTELELQKEKGFRQKKIEQGLNPTSQAQEAQQTSPASLPERKRFAPTCQPAETLTGGPFPSLLFSLTSRPHSSYSSSSPQRPVLPPLVAVSCSDSAALIRLNAATVTRCDHSRTDELDSKGDELENRDTFEFFPAAKDEYY